MNAHMLLEAAKRQYSITPQAYAKLEILCNKIIALVEQWKQRVTQQSVAGGHTSTQLQQELARYISKQTNQQLFIGTVKGFDHTLREERTFRVLLQSSLNVGGYFDDYISVAFLELLKYEADRLSVDAVAKKYKVKKTVVQYAQETPVKDLRNLRGRGDIVINLSSVLISNPVPEIMDVLTHELTHGVQTHAPHSSKYIAAVSKMHAGEELSRQHLHGYYRERSEFEAQLNGMLTDLKYKYQQKGDAHAYRKEMSEKYTPNEIAELMRGSTLEQTLKNRQQNFKQLLIDRLLNVPREVVMDIDKNGKKIQDRISHLYSSANEIADQADDVQEKLNAIIANEENLTEDEWEQAMDLQNQIDELKDMYDDYRNQGVELEEKYYLLKTTKHEFISAIAGNKRLWNIYHKALSDMINTLN